MFLAAVARPRFDMSGHEIFSGKIGIFPFTTLEQAKRSSKNRVAGTLETKPILSVTKDVTRSWLIHKVLPAIRAKWPQGHTGPIFIQQDNVKPHIDVNDVEFLQEVSRDGFDIRLRFQPPNSPDLNVLDLSFFRAIQSLQEGVLRYSMTLKSGFALGGYGFSGGDSLLDAKGYTPPLLGASSEAKKVTFSFEVNRTYTEERCEMVGFVNDSMGFNTSVMMDTKRLPYIRESSGDLPDVSELHPSVFLDDVNNMNVLDLGRSSSMQQNAFEVGRVYGTPQSARDVARPYRKRKTVCS
ncbi:hypothetical protein Tco_1526038 [Tanacetum coccineum]